MKLKKARSYKIMKLRSIKTVREILQELFSYIKVKGQGQRLKVTDNCHLHRYTCAKFEVVCPNCSWDITRKSNFNVFTQGQKEQFSCVYPRSKVKGQGQRSQIIVTLMGIYIPSLKLFAQTVLEILRKRAIFMCFMTHLTSNDLWPLPLSSTSSQK